MRIRRGIVTGVGALSLLVAAPVITGTPAQALPDVSVPVLGPDTPPPFSVERPLIVGEVTRGSTIGSRPVIIGTSNANADVTLLLRRRGASSFVPGPSTTAAADGVWRLSYLVNDDYEYVVRTEGLPLSNRITRLALPSVDELAVRRVGRTQRIVVVGKAVPRTRVVVSYRTGDDEVGTFPRTVTTRATASGTYAVPLPRPDTSSPARYSVRAPGGR